MMFSKSNGKDIRKTLLPNQLNVITDKVDFVESVIVGVMVAAGSQNELDSNNGVAHFLEHMAFKGTETRTAKQISDAIESVGGYTNAYTSKERTMYYIKVLKEDLELAVSILADILQNSIIDQAELEKERGVILQEMKASLDTPSDIVFDYFAESLFGKSTPLGRSIIGNEATIKGMGRPDILKFVADNYYAQNMVIGACGKVEHNHFVGLIEKYFNKIPVAKKEHEVYCTYVGSGGVLHSKKDLRQMQFLLGFPGYSDEDFEMSLKAGFLASVLGGGMSSRLFQEVREKRGLAYSVSSYSDSYKHTGTLCCYADSSIEKLDEVFDTVAGVLRSVAAGVTAEEVNRTLHQYKASMLMSQESLHSRIRKMLDNFLTYGRYIEPSEIMSIVSAITPEVVSGLLHGILSNKELKPTLLVYGDFQEVPDVVRDFAKFSFV